MPPWRHSLFVVYFLTSTTSGPAVALASSPAAEPLASAPAWSRTGSLAAKRAGHISILLRSGEVLTAGGAGFSSAAFTAELYNPATGTWRATGAPILVRFIDAATLLPSGELLAVGGPESDGEYGLAELYNPETETWRPTGDMLQARLDITATLLPSGQVLVAGGSYGGAPLSSSELYDPATGTWRATGELTRLRGPVTSILLNSGKVLAIGTSGANPSAELYDPATGTWSSTGKPTEALQASTATLLHSGEVLILDNDGTAELYDPVTGIWRPTGQPAEAFFSPTATLLPNGKVLVAGGAARTQLYLPDQERWTDAPPLSTVRVFHSATLLFSQAVLVVGGASSQFFPSFKLLDSTELYQPRPLAGEVRAVTAEDQPVALSLEATDMDGDPLTFRVLQPPTHGTLAGSPPHLTYSPSADFHGQDAFTYVASDGHLESDPATVSITIVPVNDAPSARDLSLTTVQDAPTRMTLVGLDVDGDALTFAVLEEPRHGRLSGPGPDFLFTPSRGYGEDSFTYKVTDGELESDVATVSITVLQNPGCGGCSSIPLGGAATWGLVWVALLTGSSKPLRPWHLSRRGAGRHRVIPTLAGLRRAPSPDSAIRAQRQ
jgi:hypothetical protein